MKGVCSVCGCTEDNACVTDTGPCSWVTEDLCSACADVIPELHLIIPRMCRYCQHLENATSPAARWWTCGKGRFDSDLQRSDFDFRHHFAWSGIWRPRYRTVKKAQRYCPEFVACKNINQIHEKGRPA